MYLRFSDSAVIKSVFYRIILIVLLFWSTGIFKARIFNEYRNGSLEKEKNLNLGKKSEIVDWKLHKLLYSIFL